MVGVVLISWGLALPYTFYWREVVWVCFVLNCMRSLENILMNVQFYSKFKPADSRLAFFLAAFHRAARSVPLALQGSVCQELQSAGQMDVWMDLQQMAKNSQHSHSTAVDQIKVFRNH